MCVIVHQPIGQSLDKATATKLWQTNPDGGGFAYIDDKDIIQVEKHMTFGSFWKSFETARSNFPGRDYLLHMRIATHGSVNINNVHPFIVDNFTVMAHNGIIQGVIKDIPEGDDRTDTKFFIDEVLPRLPELWLDDPYLNGMVADWIGWSKLMFVTTNPKLNHKIYRFGDWKEHEGLPMTNVNGLIKPKSFPETQHFYVSKSKDFTKNSWDNWNEWEEDLDKKLYQLPLPKAPNVTPGYSASTEWADWIAYKEEANIDLKKLDEVDLDLLLDALDNQRKHLFINHPLLLIDTAIPLIECAQCAEEIDLDTGDCGCWDLVCKACWNFMALCLTEGNCRNASAMEYSSLSTKGKEFVHEGGLTKYTGNDKKVVEKALSEGA